ncbi:ATP-binding protein [bacterium]|nr:ATP-binding protein [bacterium]
MQTTNEQRQRVIKAVADDLAMRQEKDSVYSQSAHARYLGIQASVYSRVRNGEVQGVLADGQWVRIAKKLHVVLDGEAWKTAQTQVYTFMQGQLKATQERSLSLINCDLVGIGKTYGAEAYAAGNGNVTYVKCREGITRGDLLKQIAQGLGIEPKGTLSYIREKLEQQIALLDKPLVILDDAGYMSDRCFMEVKSLYDDTVDQCGWYLIGDTSLAKKIEGLLANQRIGWEAFFDRFGRKFQSVSDALDSEAELAALRRADALKILEANLPEATAKEKSAIIKAAGLSLRVLKKEVEKRKMVLV